MENLPIDVIILIIEYQCKKFAKSSLLTACPYFRINILSELRYLQLFGNHVTNDILEKMCNLNTLILPHNNLITDEGLKHLTWIRHLDLQANKLITDEGFQYISNVEYLNLCSNRFIGDIGILYLKKVQYLNLASCGSMIYHSAGKISDKALEHLGSIGIKFLNLIGARGFTDKGFNLLKDAHTIKMHASSILFVKCDIMPNVKHMMLNCNSSFNDVDLKLFPNVEYLVIRFANITDKGLKYIPKIKHLELRESKYITDIGLSYIPNIETLDLCKCVDITNQGIIGLKKIQRMDLSNSMVTREFIRQNLPNVSITLGN